MDHKGASVTNASSSQPDMSPNPMKDWVPSRQPQSLFFRHLPQEIRDMIYQFAFGDEQRDFNFNGLVLAASSTTSVDRSSIRGLDTWLLVSKSMCMEAMETFARTRHFSPRSRGQAKSAAPNSLVLHESSIRNITLRYPYESYPNAFNPRHSVHPMPPRMFLKSFSPFFADNLCLTLHWGAKYQGYMFWPSKWNGRFRTVEIRLSCRFTKEIEMQLWRRRAESVAWRLVGDYESNALAVAWGTESKQTAWRDGEILWKRELRLVVLRRI